METVDDTWKDYFMVRFITGIRSCELHALQRKHINLENRVLHIRQNLVDGEIVNVKTVKSNRDLPLNNILLKVFQRITKGKEESEFLFTDVNGDFLNCRKVSRQVWHPTLKKAGLKKRRAYETRHTAAVLHLSAYESPLYVAQLLGHSDAKLLFEVYAPYIKNAVRQDGIAFEQLFQEKSNSARSEPYVKNM